MTVIGASMIAVGTVFFLLYLKPQQKELSTLLSISATLILFFSAMRGAGSVFAVIRDSASVGQFALEVETILKALGVAAVAQITADICREAGENGVASKVEMFGKMEIVLLSLPLATELLAIAKGYLS